MNYTTLLALFACTTQARHLSQLHLSQVAAHQEEEKDMGPLARTEEGLFVERQLGW